MTRLLPPGMHLVYGGLFLQPYSPDECDPGLLENEVVQLDGEFKGVAVSRRYLENVQKYLGQAQEETIKQVKQETRGQLIELAQSGGFVDPMGAAEYEGDTSDFNMTREELQGEFDKLCEEFNYPVKLVVKICVPVVDDAFASTMLYGMPHSRRPHLVVVSFFPFALYMGKPQIRSVIRHEFAHCLADIELWPQGETSVFHDSPEWHHACERLCIAPDDSFEPHEWGFFRYSCPCCGDIKYELDQYLCEDDEEDEEALYLLDEWDGCCVNCGTEYDWELRYEPLSLTDSGVYVAQEDGRELPLGVTFEELVPWCLSDD